MHAAPVPAAMDLTLPDNDRSEARSVIAIVRTFRDRHSRLVAAGPKSHLQGVGARWRRHIWHIHLVRVAYVFARQPV